MLQRCKRPIDSGWASPLMLLQVLEEPRCHGASPLVGMIGANGVGKEVEKGVEIASFRLGGVFRTGGGFKLHVQVEPSNETVRLVQRNRCRG